MLQMRFEYLIAINTLRGSSNLKLSRWIDLDYSTKNGPMQGIFL